MPTHPAVLSMPSLSLVPHGSSALDLSAENLLGVDMKVGDLGQGPARGADGTPWICQAFVLDSPYAQPRAMLTFNGLSHRLMMGLHEWDRAWVEGVIRSFIDRPAFRDRLLDTTPSDRWEERWFGDEHPQTSILAPYHGPSLIDQPHWGWVSGDGNDHPSSCSPGATIMVDEQLGPALQRLNANRCKTLFSCQGDQDLNPPLYAPCEVSPAYLAVHPGCTFPAELKAVWTRLGFHLDETPQNLDQGFRSVHASVGQQKHGQQAALNVLFSTVLKDWANDRMDLTLDRYRPWLQRRISVREQVVATLDALDLQESLVQGIQGASGPSIPHRR